MFQPIEELSPQERARQTLALYFVLYFNAEVLLQSIEDRNKAIQRNTISLKNKSLVGKGIANIFQVVQTLVKLTGLSSNSLFGRISGGNSHQNSFDICSGAFI